MRSVRGWWARVGRLRQNWSMAAVRFGAIREAASATLSKGSLDPSGEPLLCVVQDQHTEHVAVYCNLLDHFSALDTHLDLADWSDEIELPAEFDDSAEVELLFRYYTITFLAIEECFMDLRQLATAAGGPRESKKVGAMIGEINRIWKHRDKDQGSAGAFHQVHHHGPYYFADAGQTPPTPSTASGAAPLVVPSLAEAAQLLVDWLKALVTYLDGSPAARAKVEQKWSTVPLGDLR